MIRGMGRLRALRKRALGKLLPQAVILMYHRVIDLDSYPFPITVTVDHFEQQLSYIRQSCRPIELHELAEAVEARRIPRRSVVITFDDGYADNYHNAYPLLAQYGIPATIFVVSGSVGSQCGFWWDELADLVLRPTRLYPPVTVRVQNGEIRLDEDTPPAREAFFERLHNLIKGLRQPDRDVVFDQLASSQPGPVTPARHNCPLAGEELVRLSQSRLITIGAHTLTHPALARLSKADQQKEISASRAGLEEIIGQPVRVFSYPFGSLDDFGRDSVEIVEQAGFQAACMVGEQNVNRNSEIFALPRRWVGDWPEAQFAANLERWFQTYEG